MAFNVRRGDRDQAFLLPPDVREWLPEGHLAWAVLDAVAQFDLSGFYVRYRQDGRGGAAYAPELMVAVLLYAYCRGDRSSRLIERRLVEDVAYRVVAANASPDHATIARFRAEHEAAIEGLFNQVLTLCAAAGMVQVGVVAVDGTKVEASASKAANMDDERLRRAIAAEVRRILDEAAAIDAAEDALYGHRRGDELPDDLADRSARLQRLREAKERLDAAQAERDRTEAERAARRAADAAAGRKTRGRKRKGPPPEQKPLLVNGTDPDSRIIKIPGGYCQGYNAQAAATAEQVIIAAELTNSANDVHQLLPVLEAAKANLAVAGVSEGIGVALADAGYYSSDNAEISEPDVLIATAKAHKLPKAPPEVSTETDRDADDAEAALAERRAAVLERVIAGDLTLTEAASMLGLTYSATRHWRDRYLTQGVAGLVRRRRASGEGRHPRSTVARDTKTRMEARLATKEGRDLYRRRSTIIEPVFGQKKDPAGSDGSSAEVSKPAPASGN
ncbi:MAG: transposase [Actinomycetota bacterium]